MFRICMRYVSQHADAEDCLMLGFMKVFQNISKFNYTGDHSLFIWIRKIVVNESLMLIRQKQNLMFVVDDQSMDVPMQAEIINAIEAEELNYHIMKLPTGYRTVFNLNVIEGYDHKEIASLLNISEVTSRTQLAKAKSKLRVMISQTTKSYGEPGE
ncbi:MAG: sigma-70 family RNA polymerase sigma factor [Bacteroidetes bacterium]|nr:sigma-70 family RNA polymerase sigma factor [Bacteroidota bacterium]MBK7572899.1 sigma-70 family RNA polymerase sigma factor [Bacteroidota bacterium]MBK8584680.1 sigma-70 family RNA polymerase sigma factor [Bacteroidota bacterium]